jgi:hypothetical protein
MKNEPKFLEIMRISTFLLFLCIFSICLQMESICFLWLLSCGIIVDEKEKKFTELFVYLKKAPNFAAQNGLNRK